MVYINYITNADEYCEQNMYNYDLVYNFVEYLKNYSAVL